MRPCFRLLSVLLLVLTLGSCKKEAATYKITGDYVITGQAGGFVVGGSYATYYLISNGQLRKDNNQKYNNIPDDINGFNFNQLMPTADYNLVADIPSSIPSELLNRNEQHIGGIVPDVGYTDVRTSVGGITYRWYFESDQSTSSAAVQQFVNKVRIHF